MKFLALALLFVSMATSADSVPVDLKMKCMEVTKGGMLDIHITRCENKTEVCFYTSSSGAISCYKK